MGATLDTTRRTGDPRSRIQLSLAPPTSSSFITSFAEESSSIASFLSRVPLLLSVVPDVHTFALLSGPSHCGFLGSVSDANRQWHKKKTSFAAHGRRTLSPIPA
jgi:hypothetical protein